eukprot:2792604-Prymnesium_polylepis.1
MVRIAWYRALKLKESKERTVRSRGIYTYALKHTRWRCHAESLATIAIAATGCADCRAGSGPL